MAFRGVGVPGGALWEQPSLDGGLRAGGGRLGAGPRSHHWRLGG